MTYKWRVCANRTTPGNFNLSTAGSLDVGNTVGKGLQGSASVDRVQYRIPIRAVASHFSTAIKMWPFLVAAPSLYHWTAIFVDI